MNETEIIDVLMGITDHNFIVEPTSFNKGSNEADYAKKTMAILAYKGMKEGYGIYRRVEDKLLEIHPEVDYPMILELEKRFAEENSNSMHR